MCLFKNPPNVEASKLSVSKLWFRWISFDYRATLGFGSIADGLDHVNPFIRLPIEHGIDRAKPTEKHLKEVKRIFRYLRGIVNIGLWYTKDSGFELTGFSYADYAGCKDTFKSTSGGTQFLGEKLAQLCKAQPIPATQASLKRSLFHFSRSSARFYRLSHFEIVDIEKVAVYSSLRSPNNKCTYRV
ncbi:hypothetical protein Tco_0874832 [Tanacetum coccineum]|uniref:Uncharacterized protein n=1 Tax=Tanacetum coccineum TaxID=301880 RepID=A0ABQ5BQT3_9ASTR